MINDKNNVIADLEKASELAQLHIFGLSSICSKDERDEAAKMAVSNVNDLVKCHKVTNVRIILLVHLSIAASLLGGAAVSISTILSELESKNTN